MDWDDWEKVARDLGAIGDDGSEMASNSLANQAIERLIGSESCRQAVHYYVERRPGSELLRAVLWQLRPWSAMDECFRIFQTHHDRKARRDAVELLRVVADARALPMVPAFLADEDEVIQIWGVGMLDQLVFAELCDAEEVSEYLGYALEHENAKVRKQAGDIRQVLEDRLERDALVEQWYRDKASR